MKKKVNEVELSMDADTLNKVRGKLKPTDKINLTDKTPLSTTTSSSSSTSISEDGVIEPQDNATIKYLSNVKDATSGEISKPFTIGDKKYQMVRGIAPNKEIVMAVYCHDDINESGENIIHPVEHFENTIVKPFFARVPQGELSPNIKTTDKKLAPELEEGGFDYAAAEREYHDKKNLETEPKRNPEPKKEVPSGYDYSSAEREYHDKKNLETESNSLKLSEFKHFLVDKLNGKVRKFKKAEELAKANMTETEEYMNLQRFKKHVDEALFGSRQRKVEVTETETIPDKPEVTTAIQQMVAKMKPYMDKLNEPIEKVQFISNLTKMMQLDSLTLNSLISSLKKGVNPSSDNIKTSVQTQVSENKIITKNDLINNTIKK